MTGIPCSKCSSHVGALCRKEIGYPVLFFLLLFSFTVFGSVTRWYWSGSVVPYHLFTDLDHDPAYKVIKNSMKLKKSKVFSYFFFACWWKYLKPGPDPESSKYGSGSGRPQNLRFRIRKTLLSSNDLNPQLEMHFIRNILLIPNQENSKGKGTNALVSIC